MNYIFYGTDHYLMQKEINLIIEENVTFEKEMNTSYYDATKTSMEEIIADALTLPFFSEKKVIVINRANFLSTESMGEYNIEPLEKYLNNRNEETILIFCVEKLDSRKKLVKTLKQSGIEKMFGDLTKKTKYDFINHEIKKRNLKFTSDAYREFCNRIGFTPSKVVLELDKLSLYSNYIDIDTVKLMIQRSLEDDMFDFFDALIRKNMKKVFHFWKDFNSLNIEPLAVIASLASNYRFLQQVKILQKKGFNENEIISFLKSHPYRVQKALEITHLCNEEHIQKCLNKLSVLDYSFKSGLIEIKNGLELFLIEEGKS